MTGIELVHVHVDDLHPRPENARRSIDPESVRDLAVSIAEHGVEVPLDVSPRDEGGWWINAGHRRHAALRLLEDDPEINPELDPIVLAAVPCMNTNRTELEAALLVLTENLARADLSPIEEARAYANAGGYGITQKAMAQAVGRSPATVSSRLKLLQLPDTAQQAIHEGRIPLDVADQLTRLDDPNVITELVDDGCQPWAINQAARDQERRAQRQAIDEALEQHSITELDAELLGTLHDDGRLYARRWTEPANDRSRWSEAVYHTIDDLVAGEPDLDTCAGLTIGPSYDGHRITPVYLVDADSEQARCELTGGQPDRYDPERHDPNADPAEAQAASEARAAEANRQRAEEARRRKERQQALDDLTMAIARGKTPPKAKVLDALLAYNAEYLEEFDLTDEKVLRAMGLDGIDVSRHGWVEQAELSQAQLLKLTAIGILRYGLGPWGEPKDYALELAASLGWTPPDIDTDEDGGEQGSGTGE